MAIKNIIFMIVINFEERGRRTGLGGYTDLNYIYTFFLKKKRLKQM